MRCCTPSMLRSAPRPRLSASRLADVFNVQGSELIFLVLIALLVLGPEKLPDAIRKASRLYAEFRKVANGFQSELRSALDEPVREIQKTADLVRSAATFDTAPPTRTPAPQRPTSPAVASTTGVPGPTPAAGSTAAAQPAEAAPTRPALNFGNPAARRTTSDPDATTPADGGPAT